MGLLANCCNNWLNSTEFKSIIGKRKMTVSMPFEPEPVEPLTEGNRTKAQAVQQLREEDWTRLPQVLEEEPAFLIGTRLNTTVEKNGLFMKNQRGVITDIHVTPKRIYVVLTMDNEADTG